MPPTELDTSTFKITQLTHDFEKQQSIVMIFWNDESGRRLGLLVPFGTSLKDIHEQAEKAVKRLTTELSTMTVDPPRRE